MTGFRCANLKALYEEARFLGIILNASEIAKLYREGQLRDLLRATRQNQGQLQSLHARLHALQRILFLVDLTEEERQQIEKELKQIKRDIKQLKYRHHPWELWD